MRVITILTLVFSILSSLAIASEVNVLVQDITIVTFNFMKNLLLKQGSR